MNGQVAGVNTLKPLHAIYIYVCIRIAVIFVGVSESEKRARGARVLSIIKLKRRKASGMESHTQVRGAARVRGAASHQLLTNETTN